MGGTEATATADAKVITAQKSAVADLMASNDALSKELGNSLSTEAQAQVATYKAYSEKVMNDMKEADADTKVGGDSADVVDEVHFE